MDRRESQDADNSHAHRRAFSRSSNSTSATTSTTFSRFSQHKSLQRLTRAFTLSGIRRPSSRGQADLERARGRSNGDSRGPRPPTASSVATHSSNPPPPMPSKQQYYEIHLDRSHSGQSSIPPIIPERTTSARSPFPATEREYVEKTVGAYQFDTVPTLVRTQWEYDRARRPATSAGARARPFPRHIFERLPFEVYACILERLLALYTTTFTVDVQELQRDLMNLMVVDHKWYRAARIQLYRHLWLPSNHEMSKRTFTFHRSKSRLRHLLGVLVANPGLAAVVEQIHVTDRLAAELPVMPFHDASHAVRNREGCVILEIIESIVLRCPNLQYFAGYVPPTFVPETAGLIRALSTKNLLKAHMWSLTTLTLGADGGIDTGLDDFIGIHRNWSNLDTLVLNNSIRNFELGAMAIPSLLDHLPSLRHLFIKGFSPDDFSDETLWALPSTLRSLRLENMRGISNEAFEQMAYEGFATSLQSLALVQMNITSMWTVQTLLRRLCNLHRFVFVQNTSPTYSTTWPLDEELILQSASLEDLHWNIFFPGDSTADLVRSLLGNRFPRLKRVKVPCDYDGAIQTLCRPIERYNLEPVEMELLTCFEQGEDVRDEHFLRLSRIYAQLRVRDREKQPSFNVVIQDDEEGTSQTHVIGKFLGSMDSRIQYSLESDFRGSSYALARIEDFEDPPMLLDAKEGEERKMDLRMLF